VPELDIAPVMAPSHPILSVIVPVYRGGQQLTDVLAAITASDLPRECWELVVVDDASPDDSAERAAAFADTVIRLTGRPRGPAYARNRGFEIARGDVVVFIDADVCIRSDVLRRFALHYQTGAPMPEELLQRLVAARNFNKGFATVEYIACAEVDLDLHSLPPPNAGDQALDASAFEAHSLARIAMPQEIVMRHRLPHFAHIFSGGGYAAGYYSYMWSEVLDADAFAAFQETGDIFDRATAKRLRDCIYAAGGRQDPAEAYKSFRGRLPTADALLRKRGFAAGKAAVA